MASGADYLSTPAAKAIGRNPENNISIGKIEDHIKDLPKEAIALKQVLELPYVRKVAERQSTASKDSGIWQRKVKTNHSTVLWVLGAAVVVSALALLIPMPEEQEAMARIGTAVLVYSALLVPAFIGWRERNSQALSSWNAFRGAAEALRRRRFDVVFDAQAGPEPADIPLLPLKLEYFRRYQLDVQRSYHRMTSEKNRKQARWARLLLIPCLLIVVTWGIVMLLAIFGAWSEQGSLPSFVPDAVIGLAADFHLVERLRLDLLGLLLGIVVSVLYGAIYLRAMLNENSRNAARYTQALANFDYLAGAPLEEARQAAKEGNEVAVRRFIARVHASMSTEHAEWVHLRELDAGLKDSPAT